VETKPGTGFPTQWENQEKYSGGWECDDGELKLKSTSKQKTVFNIFHNPHMPTMDDYYEPWTYDYQHLFTAPEGPDQPTARPISMVTGELIQIQAGPNWDDDLGGSPVYAQNDPNLKGLTPEQQQQLFAVERLVFFYFPRICNHCLNAACVAACPSGALYKRGEDGIVLVDQNRCRGWRACVAACPYKKVFYNWNTGKSEKCILCFPRLETGQAPACFHSCVGRIRYLGILLYDAERIEEIAKNPDRYREKTIRVSGTVRSADPKKVVLEGGGATLVIESDGFAFPEKSGGARLTAEGKLRKEAAATLVATGAELSR
jgi:nitrate reductase beta subunit